jgi:hypothetical protein
MAGEVLVHFEHGHLVLAEDLPELVVGQDFAAVLRVLQVVIRSAELVLATAAVSVTVSIVCSTIVILLPQYLPL